MGTRLTVSGSRPQIRGVVTRNLGRGMQRAGGALTTTTSPRPQKAPSPSPCGPMVRESWRTALVPSVPAPTVQAAWFTYPFSMYPMRAHMINAPDKGKN